MNVTAFTRSGLWTVPEELRIEALCSFDAASDEMVFWAFQVDHRALGSVCFAEDTVVIYYDGELWGKELNASDAVWIPSITAQNAVSEFLAGAEGFVLRNAPDDYVDDEPAPTAQYAGSAAAEFMARTAPYSGPTIY